MIVARHVNVCPNLHGVPIESVSVRWVFDLLKVWLEHIYVSQLEVCPAVRAPLARLISRTIML